VSNHSFSTPLEFLFSKKPS